MSTEYKKFKDELDYDSEPPAYSSDKSVVINQPGTVEPMGKVIRPKAGWTICCSVFTLCCCFTPLGIAALVLAVMSTTQGDYETAKKQLRLSRKLNWISVAVGIVLLVLISIYYYWIITQVVIPEAEAEAEQDAINQAKIDYVYNHQKMEAYNEHYDNAPRAMP